MPRADTLRVSRPKESVRGCSRLSHYFVYFLETRKKEDCWRMNWSGRSRFLPSKSAHLATVSFDQLLAPQHEPKLDKLRNTSPQPFRLLSNASSRQFARNERATVQPVPRRAASRGKCRSSSAFPPNAATLGPELKGSQRTRRSPQAELQKGSVQDSNGTKESSALTQAPAQGMVMMGTGASKSTSSSSHQLQAARARLQVCRSKEEKEQSPDCIRMDEAGLCLFPDIGGGESATLKLLSLQHNLISRLENVPLLTQLVVLDLYDNRVERITGLQGLPCLRVLLLGKNRLRRIEGFDALKRLEILDLHGNQLRYVDNLGQLTSLRVLNLAGNLLRNVRNLGPIGLSSLTELNLKRNRIKNVDGLQRAPHLKKILLANNDLQSFACLAPLRKLVFLEELVLTPNPLVSSAGADYRNQAVTLFPQIQSLDRTPLSEEVRQEAKLWHKKKLAEEEARKQEQDRLRKEMELRIGPPGSREEIIFQARRRWESVRKYVKKTANEGDEVKGKPKLLKGIVAAAKCKEESERLYPPATLDLDHFPDGLAQLEETESMLSPTPAAFSKMEEEEATLSSSESEEEDNPLVQSLPLEQSPENEVKNEEEVLVSQLEMAMDRRTKEAEDILPLSRPQSCTSRVAVVRPLPRSEDPCPQMVESSPLHAAGVDHAEKDGVKQLAILEGFQMDPNDPTEEVQQFVTTLDAFPIDLESIQPKDLVTDDALPVYDPILPEIPDEMSKTPDINTKKGGDRIEKVEEKSEGAWSARGKPKMLRHLRSVSLDSATCASVDLRALMPEDDAYDSDNARQGARVASNKSMISGQDTRGRSNAVVATTSRLVREELSHKPTFPRTRSQRIKFRDRAARQLQSARLTSGGGPSPRPATSVRRSSIVAGDVPPKNNPGRVLRRCDSATNLTTPSSSNSLTTSTSSSTSSGQAEGERMGTGKGEVVSTAQRKQGIDFLVEVDAKVLNIFGHGGLRHALSTFPPAVTCQVATAKFHYISYDSIVPFFGKLRHAYPSLEHFHFRANNMSVLAQLDSLSDLQGLSSLHIAHEGNPIVEHPAWIPYAAYRLSHWGLHTINGVEMGSEYRGGALPPPQSKGFESLGFLALSCLPQSALSPLAKRLHMLHCFCCCSPSTSSDESNRVPRAGGTLRQRAASPSAHPGDHVSSSGSFCTSWDEDPVLLDVIGKEALVYCPQNIPTENPDAGIPLPNDWSQGEGVIVDKSGEEKASALKKKRSDTFRRMVGSGVDILHKVDLLEQMWPTLMTEMVEQILGDMRFNDAYMKKELKKVQDLATLNTSLQQRRVNH